MGSNKLLFTFMFCTVFWNNIFAEHDDSVVQLFKIEGKVSVAGEKSRNSDWMSDTTVLVDSGDYKGFLKADGTFTINNLSSGSYLVEIASPNYQFDRYRVDITKGGKIRARQVNFLQPNSVHVVPYPLRFVASRQAAFFEIREVWKVTDLLYNPMVLMMIVPLIFVFVMPKMMSMADPESQKEMQSQMNIFQNQKQLPELSELMTKIFPGGDGNKKKKAASSGDKAAAIKRGGTRRK